MFLSEHNKNRAKSGAIHFIGIGGIGISGIAEIMDNLGYKVQGSDIVCNNNTKRLQAKNIKIFFGHKAENIQGASYVVISSAINPDNVELQEAIKRKITIVKRAEILAELMRLKCSIAVSGSHGKTTTTALIACLFEAAGLSPTVINGGIINNRATNAYIGTDPYLIVEADESDATFIKIPAMIAVITNIDPEHLDFYQNFAKLTAAFKSFITNLPFYGFGVACIDHPVVRNIVENISERKIITYGIDSRDAHIQAYNINSDLTYAIFDVKIQLPASDEARHIEGVTIPVIGKHNILNSLAAIAVGIGLDFDLEIIKNGFKNFQGVKRRFTKICEYNGAEIIDDYAHHPVEVKATLAAARIIIDKRRDKHWDKHQDKLEGKIVVFFQPHRYSRLAGLFNEFVTCFTDADIIYITDVESAGEAPIEGVNSEKLVDRIHKVYNSKKLSDTKKVSFLSDPDKIPDIIKAQAGKGDLFIFMGAGSITNWANQLGANQLPTVLAID